MSESTAVAVQKRPVAVSERGIVITDMEGMWRWAQYVAASGLAPKGIERPEAIFVATQMGLEVGLTPMAALQNIAVINGRPTIWGDAQLGVVRATGELEEFAEWYEVAGQKTNRNPSTFTDDVAAVCRVKRRGYDVQESAFSVADAKKAGLWGKTGPWTQYPARMMRFRARGFGLRDNFGDALRGMLSTEEARDIEVIDVTPPEKPRFRAPKAVTQPSHEPEQAPVVEPTRPKTETVVEPIVETAPPPQPSPRTDGYPLPWSKLQTILDEEGASFDTLCEVCRQVSVWTPFTDGCATMTDIKKADVEALLAKTKSLRTFLKDILSVTVNADGTTAGGAE